MSNIKINSTSAVNASISKPTADGDSYSVKIGKTNFIVRVRPSEDAKKPLELALREACTHDILNETRQRNLLNLEKTQKIS